jgi:HSP20 family molecular chaperone IbpA
VLPGVDPKDIDIQVQKVAAGYRNGLLESTAPIATASLSKKVEIKSLPMSRAASA